MIISRRKIYKVIRTISIVLIALTIIFNLQEYAYFLNLADKAQNISFTYKIGKDVGFSLIIFISLCYNIYRKKVAVIFPFFFFLTIYVTLCCLFSNDLLLCLSGIRWLFPVFLIYFLFPYVDRNFMVKVSQVLSFLLIVQVVFQLIQLLAMPPVNGTNALGLSARTPGLFVHPSAAGFFANVCLLFNRNFGRISCYYYFLVILSLLLAMSSTGTFIFFIIVLFIRIYKSKYFSLLAVLTPFLFYILFSNLDAVTGREQGSSNVSGGTRIEILKNCIEHTELISTSFGTATNAAVNLHKKDAFIADSTYTSVYVNMGLLAFAVMLLMILYAFVYVFRKGSEEMILFLLVYILGSISIIVFEIFPMNFILSISVAYYLKNALIKRKYIAKYEE